MKNKTYWINWAKKAGIRAVKTVAQAGIAGIGTAAAMGQVEWRYVLCGGVGGSTITADIGGGTAGTGDEARIRNTY